MNGRDADTKVLVALQRVEKLTPRKRDLLLGHTPLPSGLLTAEMKPKVAAALGESAADFYRCLDESDAFMDGLADRNIGWVTYLDDEYSDLLRETEGRPQVLFTRGNTALLNTFAIAVVGTRRPTRYGAKLADEFAREFARAGITVVSGFARGIDSCAHRACVESGAPTVAVFGCGVDVCYPAENRELYASVLSSGGLFVSEYAPGTHPMPYRFPERNRIIAALADAVCVVEARQKSGTMNTVGHAKRYGRTVFAVPGAIFSPLCGGTNQLLEEGQAYAAPSAAPILRHLGIEPAPQKSVSRRARPAAPNLNLSAEAKAMQKALTSQAQGLEPLAKAAGLSAGQALAALMELEVSGIAVSGAGGQYRRA